MSYLDQYENYRYRASGREPLKIGTAITETDMENARVRDSASERYREVVPGGYLTKEGVFEENPYVRVDKEIALAHAREQLEERPVMPEDDNISLRFPGISPMGKYCSVDMRFAQRLACIEAAKELRSPEVAGYADKLLALHKDEAGAMGAFMRGFRAQMSEIRVHERASKLAHSEDSRRILHEESRRMESAEPVRDFDLYLQGIEYAVGLDPRRELEPEVKEFFQNRLHEDLEASRPANAYEVARNKNVIHVEFQDFDEKLKFKTFADPKNWYRDRAYVENSFQEKMQTLKGVDLTSEDLDNTVAAYARATADRAIHTIFDPLEKTADEKLELSRGDYIIVDGQTVRERMIEEYAAERNGSMDGFDGFYTANVRQKTNEYVSAALMAGKRVETFVPDRFGRIPKEPMQITKSGYAPSPLKKVTLNAWERFFAKRGFYKEKVAKAAEYERLEAARDRLRQRNFFKCTKAAFNSKTTREVFFGDWSRKNGRDRAAYTVKVGVGDVNYSLTRTADLSTAVCCMAARGYRIEDILDPTKEREVKQAIGAETMNRFEAHDHDWITKTHYEGRKAILRQIDDKVKRGFHIEDEKELFRSGNQALLAIGEVLFDSHQEIKGSNAQRFRACALNDLPPAELAGLSREQIAQKAAAAADELDNRNYSTALFLHYAAEDLEARFDMAEGKTEFNLVGKRFAQLSQFEALRRAYGEALWGEKSRAPKLTIEKCENPKVSLTLPEASEGRSFSTILTAVQSHHIAGELLGAITDGRMNVLRDDYAAHPENMRSFGRSIVEGKGKERFVMELHENGNNARALRLIVEKDQLPVKKEQQAQNQGKAPAAPAAGSRKR